VSQIHRVIILNKPLKIFDFTPFQLILMFAATITSFLVAGNVPRDWKLPNGLPVGFVCGLLIFCVAIVVVKMSEVKPWVWWRNMITYKLGLVPLQYLPRPEPGIPYPDPTIMDVKKRTDQYYVDADS
jgi:uncharacterized membrane protein